VLDHFLDEAALPELIENLRDEDDLVRARAMHALACDRCKEGACRSGETKRCRLLLGCSRTTRARAHVEAVSLQFVSSTAERT
jgi:hypothetical protein